MGKYKNISIIIPSLNPDEKMIKLIKELIEAGYDNLVVINDGSSKEYDVFFQQAEELGCQILKHYINMGKGRALKNAFNYVLNEYPEVCGVITADSDGQHSLKDITKCAELLLKEQGAKKLFLGSRDFDAAGIPARSRFGNKMTCKVLSAFCGIKISDTQTGLRGVTREALAYMLDLNGERYEYEMNMIIETKEKDIAIEEFPIETIYIDDNASSHFNPIVDSYKIYKQFFKYIFASLSSFVIDMALFALLSSILKDKGVAAYIIISTYGARFVSSIYNFLINKKVVFKSDASILSAGIKYAILCVIQGTLSGILVNGLFGLTHIPEVVCKMIIDTLLFFASFFIQKNLVFNGGKK